MDGEYTSPLLTQEDVSAFPDEKYTKDFHEHQARSGEAEEKTKSLLAYVPFFLLVNISAISFGTTLSFTGPTINAIIDDLKVTCRDPQDP